MERREAVVKISWMLKAAFLTPTFLSVLQSCRDEVSNTTSLLVLNNLQGELVDAIADTIIPRTTTPSASDVEVGKFMDLLLKDVFEEEVRQSFLNGLIQFDKNCQSFKGSSFIELSEVERFAYLEKIEARIVGEHHEELVPFYTTFKHLTISIYFSTEQGVKQNLNYVPIPGPYKGEVEYKEGDKIMIGNRI